MRITKIWDADYPWDIRVEKIIKTLSKNGHSVSLVCRNLKNLPTFETMDNVKIFRLPAIRCSCFNRFASFPYFFNLVWLSKIYHVAIKERADAILVRDLPLALAAVIVGRWLRVPVVLDCAENYPAMLKDSRRYGKFRLRDLIIRNIKLAKLVEWLTFRHVSKVIVVEEENRKRVIRAGFRPGDIYLVSNTPELEAHDNYQESIGYEEKTFFLNRFTVIYVGALGPIRGLDMVVRAMKKIRDRIPEVHLLLVGRGEKEQNLRKLVLQEQMEKYVTFKGWIDSQHIPQFLRLARVGLIPHLSTEHTNTTIPNKIFDYMASWLPVIASDIIPLKRVIEAERCGVTFRVNNERSLLDAMAKVYGDKENIMGKNGRIAVSRRYNWENDSTILLQVFQDLFRAD